MKLRSALCIIVSAVVSSGGVHAQSPYDLCWSREGWLVGGGLVLGASSVWTSHSKTGLTPEEITGLSRSSVNAFDRGATWNYSESAAAASDWLVYGLIASPALMLADSRVRDDWQTYTVMYAETMLLTLATVELLKGVVDRTRPFVYNSEAPAEDKTDPDARKSFYSSHTAFAFGSAVFLSATYSEYFPESRWSLLVWTGSLLAATAVGTFRYTAGMHFPTDILTGALVGGAVGYLIPLVHRTNGDRVSVGLASLPPQPSLRVVVRL